VLEDARRLARRLREEHPEIQRAILFGSFARGTGGPRSDLDMVLIVDHIELNPRDRLAHYLPVSSRPVDLFVYTSAEVDRMRASPPPVLREALTRGLDLLAPE
jgi:predicted nucleotidyltransferase